MGRRIWGSILNQVILIPVMEILIIPVFMVVSILTGWLVPNLPAEAGWIYLLISIPFGMIDSGELAICFLGRVWQYGFSLIGESVYFLLLAIGMTYIYLQLSEFVLMTLFRRDIGMMLLHQRLVDQEGQQVTHKQAVRRGFCKWNTLMAAPIMSVKCLIKGERLALYDGFAQNTYWDEQTGTQVIEQ